MGFPRLESVLTSGFLSSSARPVGVSPFWQNFVLRRRRRDSLAGSLCWEAVSGRAPLDFGGDGGIRRAFRCASPRKPHRAAAAAPLAKNSPQDCFLNARAFGSHPTVPPKKNAQALPERFLWRRRRDSNPRAGVTGKLISSQPRYDHFDTSPYCQCILAERTGLCQLASTTLTGSFSSQQYTLLRTTSTSL